MLPKGSTKISIPARTAKRLDAIRCRMIKEEPDKYDETTTYSKIISWLIDKITYQKST